MPITDFGDTPHFSTANLPTEGWRDYCKQVDTRMIRVDGPFVVETTEGPITCRDGWLAVDGCGYPYPIAADEHTLIYGEAPVATEPPVAAALAVIACVAGLFGAALGIALAYAVGFGTATIAALVLMVAATMLGVGIVVHWERRR